MLKAFQSKTRIAKSRLHRSAKLGIALLSALPLLFSPSAYSAELPNFKAEFNVQALGLNLGQAKHSMQCTAGNCTLKSDAKPSGLAAAFFKDSSHETIQLKQTQDTLSWQSYHKLGISYKDGKSKEKVTNLKLDPKQNKVIYPEKNREWPMQPQLFDVMSIAYAIQHAKLNNASLQNFTLQDTNFQDKLVLKSTNQHDFVGLDFADNNLDAVKYHFTSQHAEIELWLLPKYNYFPGKIRILNKDEKTITLSLAEPPKLL
ncbi:hypothetical protein THMIRHAM_14590 [Thiomicrorhabdus immobilis]|uniref:DUF3108 domain-containing protein n=1 Tax=Thiomicrorhabdus immobilis TaxID=2791037 RepID=A0ABM7ME94_9GAMM|nr:DUF3108 domain-containing protein [Thiomicrorhabdus immobilis]BCN93674.1 hypothetical protein THMIRHAM_14590 [Thiomicrorhabdus immobilis]